MKTQSFLEEEKKKTLIERFYYYLMNMDLIKASKPKPLAHSVTSYLWEV